MPHIHTDPGQYDFTASAFIMRDHDNNPELLVIKHKILAKFLQPGGHVELDETPWQTVVHEVREETGIAIDQLSVLQPKLRITDTTDDAQLHPVPLCVNSHGFLDIDHHHTDISYAFVCREPVTIHPDAGEAQEYRWLTEADIEDLGDDMMPANVRSIARFAMQSAFREFEKVSTEVFS